MAKSKQFDANELLKGKPVKSDYLERTDIKTGEIQAFQAEVQLDVVRYRTQGKLLSFSKVKNIPRRKKEQKQGATSKQEQSETQKRRRMKVS